jgi:hypothetical protein
MSFFNLKTILDRDLPLKKFEQGYVMGEINFVLNQPMNYTALASKFSKLNLLARPTFMKILH